MERITMWDSNGKEHSCHPADRKTWLAKGWSTEKPSSAPKKPAPKAAEKKV